MGELTRPPGCVVLLSTLPGLGGGEGREESRLLLLAKKKRKTCAAATDPRTIGASLLSHVTEGGGEKKRRGGNPLRSFLREKGRGERKGDVEASLHEGFPGHRVQPDALPSVAASDSEEKKEGGAPPDVFPCCKRGKKEKGESPVPAGCQQIVRHSPAQRKKKKKGSQVLANLLKVKKGGEDFHSAGSRLKPNVLALGGKEKRKSRCTPIFNKKKRRKAPRGLLQLRPLSGRMPLLSRPARGRRGKKEEKREHYPEGGGGKSHSRAR